MTIIKKYAFFCFFFYLYPYTSNFYIISLCGAPLLHLGASVKVLYPRSGTFFQPDVATGSCFSSCSTKLFWFGCKEQTCIYNMHK